jgi:ketosteroid isomerase-like protein
MWISSLERNSLAMNSEYADKLLATTRHAAASAAAPEDPQMVLSGLFDAIVRNDFDTAGTFMTDDVELNICGFPAFDGNWHGRDQVVATAIRNFGNIENQQPKIEAMISNGGSIAVLVHETGKLKSTGHPYSIRLVQWYTFENGKIKKVDQIAAGATSQSDGHSESDRKTHQS